MNRDLDAEIAEKVFKWRLIPISKYVNGENASEILLPPDGDPLHISYKDIPLLKVHKGYYVPPYTKDLKTAIRLCKHVRLPLSVKNMPLDPEVLAKETLDYYLSINKMEREYEN